MFLNRNIGRLRPPCLPDAYLMWLSRAAKPCIYPWLSQENMLTVQNSIKKFTSLHIQFRVKGSKSFRVFEKILIVNKTPLHYVAVEKAIFITTFKMIHEIFTVWFFTPLLNSPWERSKIRKIGKVFKIFYLLSMVGVFDHKTIRVSEVLVKELSKSKRELNLQIQYFRYAEKFIINFFIKKNARPRKHMLTGAGAELFIQFFVIL